MYTCAYLHVTTRKSSTVTILLVTTRKFGWPACNSWPLIGRLTRQIGQRQHVIASYESLIARKT